jgi:hypothetical protein
MLYFFLDLLDYLMLFDAHDPIINFVNVLMICLNEVKFFLCEYFLQLYFGYYDCEVWYLPHLVLINFAVPLILLLTTTVVERPEKRFKVLA